jgi:hypothetical protein
MDSRFGGGVLLGITLDAKYHCCYLLLRAVVYKWSMRHGRWEFIVTRM